MILSRANGTARQSVNVPATSTEKGCGAAGEEGCHRKILLKVGLALEVDFSCAIRLETESSAEDPAFRGAHSQGRLSNELIIGFGCLFSSTSVRRGYRANPYGRFLPEAGHITAAQIKWQTNVPVRKFPPGEKLKTTSGALDAPLMGAFA